MSEYFEQLDADFTRAGLRFARAEELPVINWPTLHELLDRSSLIGCRDPSTYDIPLSEQQTDLGKTALELCQRGVGFMGLVGDFNCCGLAESLLIQNIASRAIQNPDWRSPLLLTDQSGVIGIMKGYGEPSCLVLQTDLERDLVAGTFAEAKLSQAVVPPMSDNVTTLPLSAIDNFSPLRFSGFAVPREERLRLRNRCTSIQHREVFSWTIDGFRQWAAEALPNAEPALRLIDAERQEKLARVRELVG